MAHLVGQKRNCPFDSDNEKTIKQIKCEPPIDVVNYVPKTDITNDDTDSSDIVDVKSTEEKPSNESAYWSSISTPEKPILKHSTEEILKRNTTSSSSDDLLARFPHLPEVQKTPLATPVPPFGAPLLSPALMQSIALRQQLGQTMYGQASAAWNTLALYQSMLARQRSPLQPWGAQYHSSPVTTPLNRTVMTSSSTDSGSDQETDRPMTFSTPIRGKIDSSKTTDSGFGEVKSLKQPNHEQFVSTPPSSSCGVEISPIEKKRSNKYTCKQCDYQAPSLTALKAHLREHDLPCKCPICHKGFTRQWLLEGHIRTHNGEKPFECEICGRAFADRSNMRSHRATHDPQRRYTCPHCKKSFSRKSVLQKHMSNRVCLKRKSDPGLSLTPPKTTPPSSTSFSPNCV